MTVKRVEGSNPNRQYFEITRRITGKKEVVSVNNKNADKFEKLRNKYESEYIDENGNIRIISKKEVKWGLTAAVIGAACGALFAAANGIAGKSKKNVKYPALLLTSLSALCLGIIGQKQAKRNLNQLDIRLNSMINDEKNIYFVL